MDPYRLFTRLVALWMRDSGKEPTKGTAISFAEQIKAAMSQKQIEIEPGMEPFTGAAWQAVEMAFMGAKDAPVGSLQDMGLQ